VKDWNVVISLFQDGYRHARRLLKERGPVERSLYHNVLVMKVDDPIVVLETIERMTEENPALYDAISRVAPAMRTFDFQSAEEFRERSNLILCEWSQGLAGQSFHVRLHRRGAHHQLKTPDIERFLDDAVLALTRERGPPGRISFTDPDAVVAIDTIDDRAGLGLWTREDLSRHRLLRPG
jgi:tRNA(Ser,Leu) C12 N-acetylase TAN1